MGYMIAFGVGALMFGTATGRRASGKLARAGAILAVAGLAIVGALALAGLAR